MIKKVTWYVVLCLSQESNNDVYDHIPLNSFYFKHKYPKFAIEQAYEKLGEAMFENDWDLGVVTFKVKV